jgi:hypothetical protein
VDLLDHARTFLRDIVDALELGTADIVANSIGEASSFGSEYLPQRGDRTGIGRGFLGAG